MRLTLRMLRELRLGPLGEELNLQNRFPCLILLPTNLVVGILQRIRVFDRVEFLQRLPRSKLAGSRVRGKLHRS